MAASIKLLLCSLALAASMLNGLLAEESVEEEWIRLTNSTFINCPVKVTAEDTLGKLKRIDEIYPLLAQEGNRPPIEYLMTKSLLEYSQLKDSSCNQDLFMEMDTILNPNGVILQANFTFGVLENSFVPYMSVAERQLFAFCRPTYLKKLRKAVSYFSKQEKEEAQSLTQKLIKLNQRPDDSTLTKHKVISTSLERMEKSGINYLNYLSINKSGSKIRRATSIKNFEEMYEAAIGKICRIVRKDLDELMEFYFGLVFNARLSNQLSLFELDWIGTVKVCLVLAQEREANLRTLRKNISNDPEDLDRWNCYSCSF